MFTVRNELSNDLWTYPSVAKMSFFGFFGASVHFDFKHITQ